MNDKGAITVETYFKKGNHFIIPSYQRGYKWSVTKENEKSSVDIFCESLIEAFKAYKINKNVEYFIEAVTVVQENDTDKIILVDGQQRTTTLFLFFLVLKDFEILKNISLKYDIREDSNIFLQNLLNGTPTDSIDIDTQDIFYFEKSIDTIKNHLINEHIELIENNEFNRFLKKNVKLLFNRIPLKKSINTFIALNGIKAIMKTEELIKSEFLIKSSRSSDKKNNHSNTQSNCINDPADEWKINEDRSRIARNWDKWLYWWNQESIKYYFGTKDKHPLYYLLLMYWNINKDNEHNKIKVIDTKFTFFDFKNKFISNKKDAKNHLEGLRKLQKSFEDLYSDYERHNFLGLILKTSNSKDDALIYFLDSENKEKISLEEYAKWALVGITHAKILNRFKKNDQELEVDEEKNEAEECIALVNKKYVYLDENDMIINDKRVELAFGFLLLLNILEDNKLQKKFNFSIWGNRSLEHIYPKSKKSDLNFDHGNNEGSIHCIGNLVLLHKHDNSIFGAKTFQEKKDVYFDTSIKFKSRSLFHTISVFAKNTWAEEDIITNKTITINKINQYYGI